MSYPLSILLSIAIWVVCLIPVPETPLDGISFIDKWTHFVMYGTLTLVILFEHHKAHAKALKSTNSNALNPSSSNAIKPLSTNSLLILLPPIIMGGLVELAQAYLTTCRSGDWFDFLCNTLGVLLGAALFRVASRFLSR